MNGAPQPVLRASAWACLPAVVRTAVLLVLSTLTFSLLIAVVLHPAFWEVAEAFGADQGRHRVVLFAALEIGMALSWFVIVLRHRFSRAASRQPRTTTRQPHSPQYPVPKVTFENFGGLQRQKEQIRAVVRNRLEPERYRRYGVVRNGILLHGPRGTGKTYLAQATAGEFRLSFVYVRPTELIDRWMGASEANIRAVFQRAVESRPALLFIDEIDAIGTARQEVTNDGGGAGRSYNSVATQLMQSIDEYRDVPGLVVMAATNFLDSVDPALTREGRFDVKLRIDLPDEAARAVILRSQLSMRPCSRVDLQALAARTAGASAARLKGLVDRAAQLAADENRRITARDLERAFETSGGEDRPLFTPVDWADVIVAADVEQELRSLVSLLKHHSAKPETPQGLLLVGAPGTGKSLIARLIATQTGRSFYPVTPADVLGAGIGQSVKRIRQLFVRARENAPSIVFLDELDGLAPRNLGQLSSHDVQLTEQLLIEISAIDAAERVFLIGATNDPDRVDSRLLRSGRLGEHIELPKPSKTLRITLLRRSLGDARLAADVDLDRVTELLAGCTPDDINLICMRARRAALVRPMGMSAAPVLTMADLCGAVTSVARAAN